jgi:hypothetical protein
MIQSLHYSLLGVTWYQSVLNCAAPKAEECYCPALLVRGGVGGVASSRSKVACYAHRVARLEAARVSSSCRIQKA